MEKRIVLKKTRTILLCIVIIFCVCVGIYCKLGQTQRGYDYTYRWIDILYIEAIRPILWVCVGILAGLLTGIGKRVPAMPRRIIAIVALAVVLIGAFAIILRIFRVDMKWVNTVSSLCILHSRWLMIPGLACGFCTKQ